MDKEREREYVELFFKCLFYTNFESVQEALLQV